MKTIEELLHSHRVVGEHRVAYYVGDGDDCIPLNEWSVMLQAEAWDEGHAFCFHVCPPSGCVNPYDT